MCWAVGLSAQQPDGSSLGQQYEALLRKPELPASVREKATVELTPPPLWPTAQYLLDLFYEVNSTRRPSVGGWEPLSWLELEAYLRLLGLELQPWEIKLIKKMDSAWLAAVARNAEATQ